MKVCTLKEAEDRLGLRRGTLAEGFYKGFLSDELAIFVGGKRAVLEDALPLVNEALRRAGKLPKPAVQRD